MDVRPPELLAENFKLLFGQHFHGELVDGQIKTHPGRNAKNCCKPQRRWTPDVRHSTLQQCFFHCHLGFSVERDRSQLGFFIHITVGILHFAIIAASRGKNESMNPCPPAFLDQLEGGIQIDRAGNFRLPGARGIADDGGQMNHRRHPSDGPFDHGQIADIAMQ